MERLHALRGRELARERVGTGSKTARLINRLRERARSPQWSYLLHHSAERLPHALPVGASLLAKGPVQAPKTARLINLLREQARSHKGLLHAIGGAPATRTPVGASLLAKGSVQAPKTARLINRLRERARSHSGLTYCITRRSACHTHSCGSELARERAGTGSENSAPDQSPSRASSLPQGSYCIQSAERLPHALTVGASLLAKGPVNAPKTVGLIHRIREQARSHEGLTAFNRRSACHTHSLWERACSRKGPYRLRKQCV